MRYRLGRHRRRNLYAQHGPEPSDADVFVALFDDEHMARRVCLALNAEEQVDPAIDSTMHPLAGQATHPRREDSAHGPLTPSDECTCDHPAWMHVGFTGPCTCTDASDTCVRFERRCEQRYIGHWAARCTLAAGHPAEHVSGRYRFTQRYTQQGEKR